LSYFVWKETFCRNFIQYKECKFFSTFIWNKNCYFRIKNQIGVEFTQSYLFLIWNFAEADYRFSASAQKSTKIMHLFSGLSKLKVFAQISSTASSALNLIQGGFSLFFNVYIC
jgi:hypothetical protein